jgi:hypothetical protein
MRDAAAWRNTSVKRITGTARESMRSASTWPGPTEGSWSTSPTKITAVRVATALSSWLASGTSIIEHSPMTSTSASSGDGALRLNGPVFGSISSRW